MFARVAATLDELAEPRPGDELVGGADVVMDRAFTVPGLPADVWPWLVQLGKGRAGWYLPARLERMLPHGRRAIRHLDPRWQTARPGDVIPDYGGRNETFTVASVDPPKALVYTSRRGAADVSWSIVLRGQGVRTRVLLRLRIGPVRRVRLVERAGGWFDALTILGMARGLDERLRASAR